jgi:hypothetical protein
MDGLVEKPKKRESKEPRRRRRRGGAKLRSRGEKAKERSATEDQGAEEEAKRRGDRGAERRRRRRGNTEGPRRRRREGDHCSAASARKIDENFQDRTKLWDESITQFI